MKSYLELVSISGKVHRRQSRMTRICIILAVFLVAVIFGLADMDIQSMTEQTRHQTGDWHCKFTSIDKITSDYIAARPETGLSGWEGTIPPEAGYSFCEQPVSFYGMDETIFSHIYLGSFISGNSPKSAEEAAVSVTLAQTAGLVTGDTITVKAPDGSPSQLTISGIYENAADTLATENTNVVLLTLKGLADFDSSDLSAKWQYAVRFSPFCNVLSNITDIIRKYKYLKHK